MPKGVYIHNKKAKIAYLRLGEVNLEFEDMLELLIVDFMVAVAV